MKFFTMKIKLSLLLFLLCLTTNYAQISQEIWSNISKKEASIGKKMIRKTEPSKSVFYHLNVNALKNTLNFSSHLGVGAIVFPK